MPPYLMDGKAKILLPCCLLDKRQSPWQCVYRRRIQIHIAEGIRIGKQGAFPWRSKLIAPFHFPLLFIYYRIRIDHDQPRSGLGLRMRRRMQVRLLWRLRLQEGLRMRLQLRQQAKGRGRRGIRALAVPKGSLTVSSPGLSCSILTSSPSAPLSPGQSRGCRIRRSSSPGLSSPRSSL